MSITVKKLSNKDYIFMKPRDKRVKYNKPICFIKEETEYNFFSSFITKTKKTYCLKKRGNYDSTSFGEILDIEKNIHEFQFYRKRYGNSLEKNVARFENGKNTILYAYFKGNLYEIKIGDTEDDYSDEELELLIKEKIYKNSKNFDLIKKQVEAYEKLEEQSTIGKREPIPESVRFEVWRRDEGKCVICGSQKNLEFDHIIPVSKGGANTARNIQLLCQDCNRHKSDKI